MGAERACAVLEDGRVSCWGGTWRGQTPEVIAGIDDATHVAVHSRDHDAFVSRKNGELVRVTPDGTVSKVPGTSDVVDVATGSTLIAVRNKSGTVLLGMRGIDKLVWQKLPVKDVQQMSVGGHVCTLDAKEQVQCFLISDAGKIIPFQVAVSGPVKRIQSGGAATCATLADGATRCYPIGQGSSYKPIDLPPGKLVGLSNIDWNDGPTACLDTPNGLACTWLNLGSDGEIPPIHKGPPRGTTKAGTTQWVSNGKSACFLDDAGRLNCWGFVGHGLLGEPDATFIAWPAKVAGVEGAVSIATAALFTCASTDDGKVTCWGHRGDDGSAAIEPKVRVMPGLEDVVKVVPVDSTDMCAVKRDDSVACFGARVDDHFRKLTDAPGIRGFRQIQYLNGRSIVMLLTDQSALYSGYLIPFDMRLSNVKLTPVAGVPQATRLFDEEHDLIVMTAENKAWTMRVEEQGVFPKPQREPRLDGMKRVVSTWAILWEDGTVSFGDPRERAVVRQKAPNLVDLLDGRGPDNQLCGITTEGIVMCQGDKTWSRFPGLPKVTSAASYWGQSCVIDTCGGVHCWGTNWAGQAGQAGMSWVDEPKRVEM